MYNLFRQTNHQSLLEISGSFSSTTTFPTLDNVYRYWKI